MIAIVIGINCFIALICLGVTWFLIKLKSRLAKVTKGLENVERITRGVLEPAPRTIMKGQKIMERSRTGYEQFEPKLLRVYQILSLLNRLVLTQARPIKVLGLVRRNRPRRRSSSLQL